MNLDPLVQEGLQKDIFEMLSKIEASFLERGIVLTEREKIIAESIVALCIGYSTTMTINLLNRR